MEVVSDRVFIHVGNKRSVEFLVVQGLQVDAGKEWMFEQFFGSLLRPESGFRVFLEQFHDDVLTLVRVVDVVFLAVGELRLLQADLVHLLVLVFRLKGLPAEHELVDKASYGPPVD